MLIRSFPFFFLRRSPLFLVIDIGTTYFKIFIFDKNLKIVNEKKIKNKLLAPQKGFCEVNPTQWFFWTKEFLEKNKNYNIQAIGLTGQRETVVFWDKNTGMAACPAILWSDKRTKKTANTLKAKIDPTKIRSKTGLFWHYRYPIFKLIWASQNIEEVKNLINKKRLYFGPPSSWLAFNLSKERNYIIDHTQASRTLLYNLKSNSWDKELLKLLPVPTNFLPKIIPNFYYIGSVKLEGKKLPILSSIGDQEASLCEWPLTTTKLTLSTGVFLGKKVEKLKILPNTETSISFYDKKPLFLLEKRLNILGKDLLSALKQNNKQKLTQFQKKIAKGLKTLQAEKIQVDGGLVRDDKWGSKMKQIILELPFEFEFSQNQESSAKGVAEILRQRLKP